jgi:hypothetical protein
MVSISKRLLRVGAAIVISAAGVLGATPQISFAAPCTYQGCSGKDPQTTGCANDAVTKKELTASGIRGELRYSPSCHAYWNRISWDPCCSGLGQYATLTGGTYDATGHPILGVGYKRVPTKDPDWTPMISEAWSWELFCIYTANNDGCLYS